MKILGIESSCDETACAIVENGTHVLSNVVNSQIDLHAQYGGVIPEMAARSHIEAITPVIKQALAEAKMDWSDIDAIAVTDGPGLSGSLLIGTLAARTLAITQNKPLYGINHILGHFYANFLTSPNLTLPILALTVSGGHSQLALFKNDQIIILGQTGDDAVGEAFDKIAKIIGLPYPGGPAIDKASLDGDSGRFKFPHPKLKNPYDFSFSGLKTAVLRQAQKLIGKDYTFPSAEIAPLLNKQDQLDLAASFQKTAIDILVEKTKLASQNYNINKVALGGGVAANSLLRKNMQAEFETVFMPEIKFCTDNAAMIASFGYFWSQNHQPSDPLTLTIKPTGTEYCQK